MKGFTREVSTSVPEEPKDEPPDDIFYSYEIITDEEIAQLSRSLIYSMKASSSSASISSNGSCSSLGSTGAGDPLTVIQGPPSSTYSSNKKVQEKNQSPPDKNQQRSQNSLPVLEEELTASARIWYLIQAKGHYQEDHHHEQVQTKSSGWFVNLRNLPDRMRHFVTNKNRFDINTIPAETREQLKHIYVY